MTGETDDEEIVAGTEGEGAEGSDPGEGHEEGELSAEHADDQADDGQQDDEVEPEVGDQQARQTRGGSRIQRLANEAKAAREEAAAARREAEEFRRQMAARQSRESEEQREARRALMTPEERVQDDMAAMRREFAQQQQQTQMTTAAMLDRAAYDAKAATKPVYARHAEEVERRFQEQLRQGRPVEREIILKVLLGELALSGASNPKPRRQAQSRVNAQRVPASSGKGDTASNRGRAGDTPASRLKDVII